MREKKKPRPGSANSPFPPPKSKVQSSLDSRGRSSRGKEGGGAAAAAAPAADAAAAAAPPTMLGTNWDSMGSSPSSKWWWWEKPPLPPLLLLEVEAVSLSRAMFIPAARASMRMVLL